MALWIVVSCLILVVCVESVAVLALAREVGLLSRRLQPAPALDSQEGPALGDVLSPFVVELLPGERRRVFGGESAARPQLLLFLSTSCASCYHLLGELDAMLNDFPHLEIIPILAGKRQAAMSQVQRLGVKGPVYRDSGEAMTLVGIASTPQAVLIDEQGKVWERGIVNTRDMVGSLVDGHVRRQHPGQVWETGSGEAATT